MMKEQKSLNNWNVKSKDYIQQSTNQGNQNERIYQTTNHRNGGRLYCADVPSVIPGYHFPFLGGVI